MGKSKTPKCCVGCKNLSSDGQCYNFRRCKPWREWFSAEWAKIRKAAREVKECKQARLDKLEKLRYECMEGRSGK